MSKREEIKEEVKEIVANSVSSFNTFNYDKSLEEATDKILALAPFTKLEKVREYCKLKQTLLSNHITYLEKEYQKDKRTSLSFGIIHAKERLIDIESILSILSENEKAFDVREWLEGNEKLFQRDNTSATWESRTITDGESYVYELGATYLQINKIVWSIPGKRIEQRVYLYKGSIPTSCYFWEMLLNSLGIEI